MSSLKEIIELGKELGLTGHELQKFVQDERAEIQRKEELQETKRKEDLEREERRLEREEKKRQDEIELEKEKMKYELECKKVEQEGKIKNNTNESNNQNISKAVKCRGSMKRTTPWMHTYTDSNLSPSTRT